MTPCSTREAPADPSILLVTTTSHMSCQAWRHSRQVYPKTYGREGLAGIIKVPPYITVRHDCVTSLKRRRQLFTHLPWEASLLENLAKAGGAI